LLTASRVIRMLSPTRISSPGFLLRTSMALLLERKWFGFADDRRKTCAVSNGFLERQVEGDPSCRTARMLHSTGDLRAQGDHFIQQRRRLAELGQILGPRRQDAQFHLVLVIGRDLAELVVLERIREALEHFFRKLLRAIDA